jgi:hypothetical protein
VRGMDEWSENSPMVPLADDDPEAVRDLNLRATRLAYRGLRCPKDGACDRYAPCAACRARYGGAEDSPTRHQRPGFVGVSSAD